MRRIIPALVSLTAIAVVLTGCSPVVNESTTSRISADGCESPYSSGDSSDAITAEGKKGEAPDIDFPTPLVVKKSQATQLIDGDGAVLRAGDYATIGLTIVLGGTGETVQTIGYEAGSTVVRQVGDSATTFDRALECLTVGSRVAFATTAAGVLGKGNGQAAGLDDDATLVLVMDVKKRFRGKADGLNQLQNSALPAVVTAVNGEPGIVLPGTPAPKKETVALVKAGDGAKIQSGDTIVAHFTQWSWGGEAQRGSTTWSGDAKGPQPVVAGENSTEAPFADKLSGERIGSQLIVVIPPAEGSADDAQAQVFVVDLLGVLG